MNELHMLHTAFKAYDIRGIIPDELNEELVYRIGRAYATLYNPKTICVGYDIRQSSVSLCHALCKGLTDGGVDVYNIGLVGTEMVYFTTFYYRLDGGIMITASHNPINYNGLKIVREEGKPVSADTGLTDIERIAFSSNFKMSNYIGKIKDKSIIEDYIHHLLTYIDIDKIRNLHVVVDGGNGCADVAFRHLKQHLPLTFSEIRMNPDGLFPHGVPNPMLVKNHKDISKMIIKKQADMGIAWDGDFDRCFFFDEKGQYIDGYYMVGLLSCYFLNKVKGSTIVHDPRLYWNTRKIVTENGGVSIESKGGHAFMKETMRKVNGIYGAEMSAHHFFRDFSFCDSGMIPWLLVVQIVSETGKSLGQLIKDMKKNFPCSGEINLQVKNPAEILRRVKASYQTQALEVETIDGLGFIFEDWRFNIRRSNTEPLVRLNLETRGNYSLMEEKRDEILSLIKNIE